MDEVEVLDQRRLEPAVAEGDVAQLDVPVSCTTSAGALSRDRRAGDVRIRLVAQHVVEAAQVALDLLQRAAELDQLVDRRR